MTIEEYFARMKWIVGIIAVLFANAAPFAVGIFLFGDEIGGFIVGCLLWGCEVVIFSVLYERRKTIR